MVKRPNSLLERPTEPAPRPVRRRLGAAIALLIVVVTGWAVARHMMSGGLRASEVDAATACIARGISGEGAAEFRRAEEHLVDAASVSVLDTYPGFLITVVRRLEGGDELGETGSDAIVRSIRNAQWKRARRLAAEQGEPGTKPRVYWERLIDELSAKMAAQSSTRAE